jgi:ATP-dependent DNA helicase RecG
VNHCDLHRLNKTKRLDQVMNYKKNVADIFFKAGFIEAWGRGILLMTEEMKSSGLDEPKIELHAGGIQITFLKRINQTVGKTVGKSVEKSVEKIALLIENNPAITQIELAEATGLSRRGIEKNISKLKKEGRIKRIGPAKGGHWQVVDK